MRQTALALLLLFALASPAEAASCFEYDALGRIIVATYENGTKFSYTYDPNGNREVSTVTSGQTPTCADPGNQGDNHLPVAAADSSIGRLGILKSIDVRANDTEPDGDPITIASVTTPAKGTAVIANGKIDYTANANATGTDSFTYTISDGRGGTATATVSITQFVANSPPNAVADTAIAAPTIAKTVPALVNDTEPDGDTMTISNVSSPSKGTASISGANIIYTANANTTGSDTFNYTVTDGHGGSATVTDTITINRPPNAVADSATASPTVAATINVRANDTDPDNDALTVIGTTFPTKGTASISSNNVVYTANAGTTGADTFTYVVSDSKDSATGTINVTISNNQPPVAQGDFVELDLTYSTFVIFDPRFNDTDPNGHPLTITAKTDGSIGTVTILGGGTSLKYTYTGQLQPDFLSDEFTYTVSDGNGGTDTASVSVQISPSCNSAPGYFPPSPPCF